MTETLDRLRAICLAYPEAEEAGGVGNPSFKVRGKIFAMRHSLHEVERWSVWFKAPPGMQQPVVAHTTRRASSCRRTSARKGWIGAYLDVDQDWDELADLIDESYRMTAPKRLVDAASVTHERGSPTREPRCQTRCRRLAAGGDVRAGARSRAAPPAPRRAARAGRGTASS